MLNLYTACLSHYKDQGAILDVTRLTGKDGLIFAPSWELLRPFLDKRKNGLLSPADWLLYREGYLREMKTSAQLNGDDWATWKSYIQSEITFEFTLCCYCIAPDQCHRSILVEIFKKRGAVYLGERQMRLL